MTDLSARLANLSPEKRELLLKQLQRQKAQKAEGPARPPLERYPRTAGAPLPLSFGQQRLWFLDQFDPGNAAYNIPAGLRLKGQLNVAVLERSLNEIIRRHEVLRTRYTTENGEARLEIVPELSLALPLTDLSTCPAEERPAEAQRLVAEEARRPFDLAEGPVMRAALVRLAEEEHILVFTLHHIVSDGWSMGVFNQELAALYDAFASGQPSPLGELPLQYLDYAAWQRSWLQGEELEKQLAYWKQKLQGTPRLLEMPTDHPRPPQQTYRGAIQLYTLPRPLSDQLMALSRQEGVTLFMTLLAAFQTLLYRYTRQTDIAVGSPIANRTQAEVEGLIGFFVNTLVFRTQLAGSLPFRDLLKQVRETALGAYAHQDVPFEKLVDELQPGRDLSYSPIFQVLFALQNMPAQELALPGLTLEWMDLDTGAAQFDLSLYLWETAEGLFARLEYNSDLFEAGSVRRFLEQYHTLLEGIVARPGERLAALPLLTPAERQRLLYEWNATQAEYPPACIHEQIAAQARRAPQAAAVTFEGHNLSYEELEGRANRLARRLQEMGVGPETLVGLCVERSPEMLVGLLGILKAGGAYVPLDPALPPERLAYMLADCRAPVLVTQVSLASSLPAGLQQQMLYLDRDWASIEALPAGPLPPSAGLDTLAYTIYTSGSTGRPKGVQVSHRALANFMESMRRQPGMAAQDVLLSVTTLSFDIAGLELYLPLLCGGQVVLVSREVAADGERLIAALAAAHPTVMQATPATWRLLIESGWQGDARLKILCGGEALSRELANQLLPRCASLWNVYGPTETTIWSTLQAVKADEAGPVSIGRPIANTQAYLLDETLQPVPIGVAGELYLGGDGLARGYLNRPELTAEKFIPNPFGAATGDDPMRAPRLYRTGDLARYRPDGSLEFLGRADFQVKVRGFRIELGEIEAVLEQHPLVGKAAVVVREDTPGDQRLVAYLVPADGQAPAIAELRQVLKEKLPEYMVPATFVALAAFPLTPNGKLDRQAFPAPDGNRLEGGEGFVAPRDENEAQIAAVWAEVLGVEKIGIDDNFFDLGGESFKAVRAARKMGASVSVMDLFKHPTIRQLAAHLAQGAARPQPSGLLHELTRPVPPGQRVLTLVCAPFAGGNAITYQPLANALPKNYTLLAVEMPGHDYVRPQEALISLDEIAQRCVDEIRAKVSGPVAVMGHCLGGALATQIARQAEAAGVPVVGVFMGGHFPSPRLPGKLFELTNKLFPVERWMARRTALEFLRSMGFFTDVFGAQEQEFVIRNFLHDMRDTDDYYTRCYANPDEPKLKAPIHCIIGQMDRATELYEERYKEWEYFSPRVDYSLIPLAGHYFLKHQPTELAQIITRQADLWLGKVPTPRPATIPPAAQPAAGRPAAPSLTTFYLVALGQFVSLIGTSLTGFAMGVWVYQQTQSVLAFATISVFVLLPAILLSPIAGAAADRFDRRTLMIVSDSFAACGTLLLAGLLWTNTLQIWHIYVIASMGAIANAFQQPAYLAAISQLVPKRYYGRANGIVQLGGATGSLLAPVLGGALVVLIGLPGIVLIDFATFLFAVSVNLRLRFPNTLFKKLEEPFLREVTSGWRYITRRPSLTAIIVFTLVVNYAFSFMDAVLTPMVLASNTPTALGVVVAANGAGLLLGSTLMSLWGGTKRRTEGILYAALGIGLGITFMGLRPATLFPALGLFTAGFCIALINAHWLSIVQTKVGLELQGRVMATNLMMVWSMMPLGYLTAGPLADRVFEPWMAGNSPLAASVGQVIGSGAGRGMGLMLVLAGVFIVIWSLLGYRYRPIHYLEDLLPDAIPDAVILANKDRLQELADRQLSPPAA